MSNFGGDTIRSVINKGRGRMPAIPGVNADQMNYLMAFLSSPESAPPGSAAPAGMLAMRGEPDYPAEVTPPPSRYKTGYGNEPYVITPPWSTITA